MMHLFHKSSTECSKIITQVYSTSFASSIRLLHADLREDIYNIYGFVRIADEVVDTFHDHNKQALLDEFKQQTFEAIDKQISLNPILHSFQLTINKYNIDHDLIHAFFRSMYYDLFKQKYNIADYNEYIFGSAEVIGLMCLYVFCEGNAAQYNHLKSYAQKLGAAFQKVNFLRDIKSDNVSLKRMYFPECDFFNFSNTDKVCIEQSIEEDFAYAYTGIKQLPVKARFGVYVAYKYYYSLFDKIKRMTPQTILEKRVRIPDFAKALILAKAGLRLQFKTL